MLNVSTSNMLNPGVEAAHDDPSQMDVSRLFSAIKQQRKLIYSWVLSVLGIGVLYLLLATPVFKASSTIFIDTQTSRAMEKQDLNAVETPVLTDTSFVDSEVEVLSSDGMALKVVRALDLASDPEFVGPHPGIIGWISSQISGAIKFVISLFTAPGPDNPELRAVDAFGRKLVVKRIGLTYIITITVSSETGEKAAKIANSLTDLYLKGVLEAKYGATRQTGDWLQSRLAAIQRQVTDAARAVEVFKADNNIVDTNHGLLNEQELGELNSQLALAAAATAETKARLDRAREVAKNPLSGNTTSEALNNNVVSRLRAQYLDLAAREGDLTARFGANHDAVVILRRQMNEISKSALEQIKQIVDADESDYQIAAARENSLRASLASLVSKSDQTSLAQVKLKDLESTAEALRTLYNNYLQKYQEALQRTSFPVSDARVVTAAVAPLEKSSPKTLIVLGGGLVLGLFLGIGHVFAREMFGDKFVFMDDVQSHTGLRLLGILPEIVTPPTPKGQPPLKTGSPDNYVIEYPYSRFAETIRTVKVAIDAAKMKDEGKIIAVTSSVPEEGKTTVAINLAQLLASTGARTLLIDGDFTSRTLSGRLASESKTGLLDVLEGKAPLRDLVAVSARTGLEILPCISDGRIKDRAELLQSSAFANLLAEARQSFAYVILDMAPIVPVVDTQIVAPLVDAFLLVIEWSATSRKVVVEALSVEGVGERMIGTIVNKVDNDALKQIESYRGKACSSYYL